MELTHEDVRKIVELVDRATHLDEIEIVYGEFRLHVRRSGSGETGIRKVTATPVASPDADAASSPTPVDGRHPAAPADRALSEGEVAVRAPMLGTFYRSPSPNDRPFVEVGQRVKEDDIVCLIEVMKLFSSIRAGIDGVVARFLVENGALVEYDQPVIVIARDRG
jgi:acetyl-CoA carboxylase biotin carboxyl carrier protein